MAQASLHFLCACIAEALLAHYGVRRLPVPVRDMLQAPPPDLAHDLGLVEDLPFGAGLWLRLSSGTGAVYVNPHLDEPEKRYAMAAALFTGLCDTRGGRAAGLPPVPNPDMRAQQDVFARRLLLPPRLLPPGWEQVPAQRLAELGGVPLEVAARHQAEALARARAAGRAAGAPPNPVPPAPPAPGLPAEMALVPPAPSLATNRPGPEAAPSASAPHPGGVDARTDPAASGADRAGMERGG